MSKSGQKKEGQKVRADFVVGRNAVTEVVNHSPERIVELLYTTGDSRLSQLIAEARGRNLSIRAVSSDILTKLTGVDKHQGCAVQVLKRTEAELGDLVRAIEADEQALIILLNSIEDPHNLGAILRAAECFGAMAVVLSHNRGSAITPIVTKVSVGASEIVNTISISNVSEAARKLKRQGWWLVGAATGDGSENAFNFSFPKHTCLVLGSEGSGIQRVLLDQLDFKIRIPMYGQIDSLNVSQATAALCALYRRQFPHMLKT